MLLKSKIVTAETGDVTHAIIYTVSQKCPTFDLLYSWHTRFDYGNFCQNITEAIKVHFIFPPHITSAYALPGKTWNRKLHFFHLNATFLQRKTHETHENVTRLQLNRPSLSKLLTGCTRQDLGKEHSILLSVTHMLYDNQVCHGVGRCVKDVNCSSSSLEWKCESQWTVGLLMGYLTISTNVRRYQTYNG